MQYYVSRNKVVQYITKYGTKSETRSESLKDIYSTIVRGLNDDDRSPKAIQKLLMKSLSKRLSNLDLDLFPKTKQCSNNSQTSSFLRSMWESL